MTEFILPNKGQQDRQFTSIEDLLAYIQKNKERLTMPVTVYCADKKVIIPQEIVDLPEDKLIIYMNYFLKPRDVLK